MNMNVSWSISWTDSFKAAVAFGGQNVALGGSFASRFSVNERQRPRGPGL